MASGHCSLAVILSFCCPTEALLSQPPQSALVVCSHGSFWLCAGINWQSGQYTQASHSPYKLPVPTWHCQPCLEESAPAYPAVQGHLATPQHGPSRFAPFRMHVGQTDKAVLGVQQRPHTLLKSGGCQQVRK